MSRMQLAPAAVVLAIATIATIPAGAAHAGIPFRPFCTCQISVVQGKPDPRCVSNFDPDVVRLTPAGSTAVPAHDFVTFSLTILDALGAPVSGATLSFYEQTGLVNVGRFGVTTAVTDGDGRGTMTLFGSGGWGLVSVCADGVSICEVEARSPDCSSQTLPSGCPLPTASNSSVAGNDLTDGECGFLVKFGAVTPGINNGWDMNCDNVVSGVDVTRYVLPYFGQLGSLGPKSTCP